MGNWPGVDSAHDAREIWDLVRQALGGTPFWWGRYLGPGPHAPLTRAEAEWLHEQGVAIALVWGATTAATLATPEGVMAHAAHALEACYQLGVPAGTAVFLDVEAGWAPTMESLRVWHDRLKAARYVPGYYGAANLLIPEGSLRWLAAWTEKPWTLSSCPVWNLGIRADVWQNCGGAYGDLVDLNLAQDNVPFWFPPSSDLVEFLRRFAREVDQIHDERQAKAALGAFVREARRWLS
jgi:hypothetical protein